MLIFAPTVGRGGVHLVVETLTRAFDQISARENVEFAVLGQKYDEIGMPIHYPVAWPMTQIDPIDKLPAHPYQFPFLKLNYDIFLKHLDRVQDDYDLIFAPSSWWVMYPGQWPVRKPYVTCIPDFAFDFIDAGSLAQHFRESSRLIAQRAATTVFFARFQEKHGQNAYGFKNTAIIPHSMDFVVKDYDPTAEEALRVRTKYGLPERYVLAFHCFGHKNPMTILRAQLYARSTSSAVPPLVIAGIETDRFANDDPDRHAQDVRREIVRIGARKGVDLFIPGQVPDEDVAGLFAGATVAIFASRSEGDISGGMFNAIAAKTPMIYGDLPVFHDRLGTEQKYGLTGQPDNDRQLGIALCQVCDHYADAKQRAEDAYDHLSSYQATDVAQKYIDLFRKLIAAKKHGTEVK